VSRRTNRVARSRGIAWTGQADQLPFKPSRKLAKIMARRQGRTVTQTLTEADIPPGSLMGEQTLADIRAGRYAVVAATPSSPVGPTAERRRRKAKMARQSRKRNRGR
jgi:hypothetical protein